MTQTFAPVPSKAFSLSVITLLLAFCASAEDLGDFERLETDRTLSDVFDNSDYSFDVSENDAFCQRKTISLTIDSSIDDYADILNSAMNDINKGGGGTLKLGPGVWLHYSQLIIPSRVCLKGSGMDATIVRLGARAKPFSKAGSLRSVHTVHVTVSDLTQDGNAINQVNTSSNSNPTYGRYGWFSELSNMLHLKDVKIINNHGYGFDPHGSKAESAFYLVIENCEASNNGYDGFTLDQTYYTSMLNSHSYGNYRHGFNLVTGEKVALVKDNYSTNNGHGVGAGCGFMAQNNQGFGTNNIRFISNNATSNAKGGFCLNDVPNVLIQNNYVFTDPSENGVCYQLFFTGSDVVLDGNNCNVRPSRKFKIVSPLEGSIGFTELNDQSGYTVQLTFTDDMEPDADCERGMNLKSFNETLGERPVNRKVCCAAECEFCGGEGCGALIPGGVCCAGAITRKGEYCTERGSPCLMPKGWEKDTSADPNCDRGVVSPNGSICCPPGCGDLCGVAGCGKLLSDGVCCSSGVTDATAEWYSSCTIGGAPCEMGDAEAQTPPLEEVI